MKIWLLPQSGWKSVQSSAIHTMYDSPRIIEHFLSHFLKLMAYASCQLWSAELTIFFQNNSDCLRNSGMKLNIIWFMKDWMFWGSHWAGDHLWGGLLKRDNLSAKRLIVIVSFFIARVLNLSINISRTCFHKQTAI